jgi:hypothetical protein
MPIYISLGAACNTIYQISIHKSKKETLFFDWLMTDLISVINVLKCDNIDTILNYNSICVDINNPIVDNHSRILIKSLPSCVSIHDVNTNVTDKEIFNFIEKYKRRYNRMIDIIKGTEKIYFLRYGYVEKNTADLFIETIKNINSNCNFAFVHINSYNNNYNNNIIKSENYLQINLKKPEKPYPVDWTTSYLNWKQIFIDIENNI